MQEKNTIVPKHGSNLIEGLSQNIVLQIVVIPYMEEYFSAYLLCTETLLHIENYSGFQFGHMQKFGLFRSVSDYDFKTFSFLLFAASFAAMFCDSPFFSLIFKQNYP